MTVYHIKPIQQPEQKCTYHHPACQCREAHFRKIESELLSDRRYIQILEEALLDMYAKSETKKDQSIIG